MGLEWTSTFIPTVHKLLMSLNTIMIMIRYVLFLLVISCLATLTVCSSSSNVVLYELIEDGVMNGRNYQKYIAHDGTISNDGKFLSYEKWTQALIREDTSSLNEILRACPFSAFYFEVPPITKTLTKKHPFEFVLLEASSLAKRKPRFQSFAKPCKEATSSHHQSPYGCVFTGLSGDTTLIVPKPLDGVDNTTYTHLANFIRQGSEEQINALWKMVAINYQKHWTDNGGASVWLSTAGNGVPWLHFRLDSRPKYYRFGPFKTPIVETKDDVTEEL